MGFGLGKIVGGGFNLATLGLGSTIIDGVTGASGKDAAKGAANSQLQGIRESNQLQRDLFNAQAGISEYQRGIGNQALSQLGGLYGLQGGYDPAGTTTFGANGQLVNTPGGAAPAGSGTPNFSAFMNSPDYQFALQQGQRGLDANAAAGGNLFSGRRATAASQYNQGLATQQFGNYFNRLSSLAGIGTNANNQLGQSLQNTGNALSNNALSAGDAHASGYLGKYQAQQNGLNNLLGIGGAIAAFCDRRLKTNIQHIGEVNGIPWYDFDYIWGEKGRGPMADEVQKIRPDAVVQGPNGFLMVNVGAL